MLGTPSSLQVFLTDDHLVLVLQYSAGGTLADLVSQGRWLDPEQARWIFTQLLCALDYCHASVSSCATM